VGRRSRRAAPRAVPHQPSTPGRAAVAVVAASISDKYAAWRSYDERPDGSGIYRLVCQVNRPMRLTQAELEAHPAWRGFGQAARRHPPMRSWLAAPLTGRHGQNIGVLQLSDKYEGEFTARDEATLVPLARFASVARQPPAVGARSASRRAVAPESKDKCFCNEISALQRLEPLDRRLFARLSGTLCTRAPAEGTGAWCGQETTSRCGDDAAGPVVRAEADVAPPCER